MGKLEEYKRKRKFGQTPEPSGGEEEIAKPEPAEATGAATGKRARLPMPKLRELQGEPKITPVHGDGNQSESKVALPNTGGHFKRSFAEQSLDRV